MNTLARADLVGWLTPEEKESMHRKTTVKASGPSPGKTLFLVCSVAVHVGALTFMSSVPAPAHAAAPMEIGIELVETAPEPLVEPEPVPEEPTPEAMPLGKLDATLSPAPAPEQLPTAAEAPVVEAPPLLTASNDNPYASADTTVFTSGSGKVGASKRVARVAPSAAPESFGVENGSLNASKEATEKLSKWYGQVRAQLAQRGVQNYPRRAEKLKQQGTARVTVRIDAQGKISGASLASGSGFSILDRAAVAGVGSVSSVTPPPAGVGSQSVTVPVVFRLR